MVDSMCNIVGRVPDFVGTECNADFVHLLKQAYFGHANLSNVDNETRRLISFYIKYIGTDTIGISDTIGMECKIKAMEIAIGK